MRSNTSIGLENIKLIENQPPKQITKPFIIILVVMLLIATGGLTIGFVYTNNFIHTLSKSTDNLNHQILQINSAIMKEPESDVIHHSDNYTTKPFSSPGSSHYHIYLYDNNAHTPISPWHDIPLRVSNDTLVHFVVKIPRGEKAKMEISKTLPLNPIVQVTEDSKPSYLNLPYTMNYGAIPQTWVNPLKNDANLYLPGDSDMLDAVEIGRIKYHSGDVVQAKVLGILPLINKGIIDWKVILIDINNPNATLWDDISDLPVDTIKSIMEWFTYYKYPSLPTFGMNGSIQNSSFAQNVIESTYMEWKLLMNGTYNNTVNNVIYQTQCSICYPEIHPEYKISTNTAYSILSKSWETFLNN